jgi:hypothetical protein
MFKRYGALIFASIILFLFSCAGGGTPSVLSEPAEQPDGTFLWENMRLIRDDINGIRGIYTNFFVSDNVITAQDQTLIISIRNSGGDDLEYGTEQIIQVNLDGAWYTIAHQLSQNEEPVILAGLTADTRRDPPIEYLVDISGIGGLPPGKYRFLERIYHERLKEEWYNSAYFWVIEPGGKRPPESETEGKARKEDIILYAESLYEARRVITDKDILFGVYIENLSGKRYIIEREEVILEMRSGSRWLNIDFGHINVGMVSPWHGGHNEVFLYEPLEAGEYRVRIKLRVFDAPRESHAGRPGSIEIISEFDVISHENAPEPKWDISRLVLSPHNEAEQSAGVKMSFTDPVLNKDNWELEILFTTDNNIYGYGCDYRIEVFLDGRWYKVPFVNMGFTLVAYSLEPNSVNEKRACSSSCNPVFACGVLPAGRYRIVMDFDIVDTDETGERDIRRGKIIAAAEFIVEETLGSEEALIKMGNGWIWD